MLSMSSDVNDPGARKVTFDQVYEAYAEQVKAWRAAGKPSLPSRMADELAANPFLRAPDVATLADLRSRKDKF